MDNLFNNFELKMATPIICEEDKRLVVNFMLRSTKFMLCMDTCHVFYTSKRGGREAGLLQGFIDHHLGHQKVKKIKQ